MVTPTPNRNAAPDLAGLPQPVAPAPSAPAAAGSVAEPRPGLRRAPLLAMGGLSLAIWVVFALTSAGLSDGGTSADLRALGSLVLVGTVGLSLINATVVLAHRRLADAPLRALPVIGVVVAAGLAQSGLATVLARGASVPGLWSLAARVFELTAVAVAATAAAADFNRRAGSTRAELIDSKVAARTDGALRRARRAVESGHRHDIRSALFVVDGAARTLVTRHDDLSPENRAAMAQMVAEGLERLTALVDLRLDDVTEVPVNIVVKGLINAEQQAGHTTRNHIPAGMQVVGRASDLAAVLRTLTAAVRSTAGESAIVSIRGEIRHDGALIFVEAADAGPAAAGAWQALSARSLEPSAHSGAADALDLYVAARLVDDQGGGLWTNSPAEQLQSFVLRLPVAPQED